MRVAIVDVGSNTARLLVASPAGSAVAAVHEERALLALGDEIERSGWIAAEKLRETADQVRRYAHTARELGCATIAVIVTAPGRRAANAQALIAALERAAGVPARVLSAEEEGRLAFAGALALAESLPRTVAVCDVGGGSTEVVVGDRRAGPAFCASLDLGSLTLTRRLLDGDPPGTRAVRRARTAAARELARIEPPDAEVALATGGSARAVRRLAGTRTLDAGTLDDVIALASRSPSRSLARAHGIDPLRARTLLAGTLILAEAQRLLGVPLEVARGGLREGAAFDLLAGLAAA